ncbi:pilus assembly protein [Pseudomonas sp. NPDC077649]|uniref:pilus assembly protein n=1 Tax=Pseudomonas sp. NPDC077649 TaxID=3364423 RepID=UPI0037C7AEAA
MMKCLNWLQRVLLLAGLGVAGAAQAEDIDIFVGSAGADSGLPNIIFVLDNTSNWSRQSQQWPGGLTQGQSEVRAIKRALAGLVDKVNVGLVEFTTEGNANQDGGYVRFNLQQLTAASYAQLSNTLVDGSGSIYQNIEAPVEKRSANTPYGNLMYDVYNYLSGRAQSFSGGGTPASKADTGGYSSQYGVFRSPLTSNSMCSNTYVIFIGNPNSSGPTADSAANSAALRALYAEVGGTPDGLAGSTGSAPLPIPEFSRTDVTEPSTTLGFSSQCYTDAAVDSCTAAESTGTGLCVGQTNCSCSITTKSTNTSGCITSGNQNQRTARLAVLQGGGTTTTIEPTDGVDSSSGRAWNFDDWAKFLHDYGVPVSYTDAEGEVQQQRVNVITYAIDVFNRQQNEDHTGLMLSASEGVGGGRYFAARSEDAIVEAIGNALSDILSTSSTFAAVTLPLSATNRAQQENQVFIGMFRPDKEALPRWFGNLKRYQITLFNGRPELADANRKQAINPLSGFATECAESFWTEDSGDYWSGLSITPPPRSQCVDESNTNSVWSDSPDGPFVEKGGVAQVTRRSDLDARTLLTVGASGLTALTSSHVDQALLDYIIGTEPGAGEKMPAAEESETGEEQDVGGRPSIHGDVIHSRPLTINYGGSTGIFVYYGSNDGLFRSVRAADGGEQWSLLAPEHVAKINRLYQNSPIVAFPNQDMTATPTPLPKDYFFDGSIGQIVTYGEDNQVNSAYIYPSMRRGGRMVYGLNVTNPTSPTLLWRFGCPSLDNDTGCPTGFEGLGQSWSTPQGAFVADTSNAGAKKAVVVFGGGYDKCLDSDQAAYPCSSSAKGKGVYVLDAVSGVVLRGPTDLSTDAPVVAEVATVDMDFNGTVDFAYAADAAGGLYRVNFATLNADGSLTALAQSAWSITKIANTLDTTRRFLNRPTVAVLRDSVYVALGSGNRERPLESNYPYVSSVQDRFYAYVDLPGATQSGAVDLDGNQLANVSFSNVDANTSCNVAGPRGWYMNLNGRGEQIVNPAAIAGGQVLFNSYQPGGDKPGLCSRAPGIGKAYQRSLFTPSSCDRDTSTEIVGGGMPIPPIITTVPVTDADGNGEELVTVCIGCEGLKVNEIVPETDQTRQRIYWNTDIDR